MKFYGILFLLLAFSLQSLAQNNGKVSGRVVDTLTGKTIAGATISVLNRGDSSLVSFAMTSENGMFEIKNLAKGSYRLLVTHINYHNSSHLFSIDESHPTVNFNPLGMGDREKTLDEIVIQSEAPPITLKKDTIEYNAGSFKTQPNASVEDLLKRLPGVKVDKDGTVNAQGQKVKKVTVDGKEFFGDDPKVATRNLPADAIDKVQVYDRMSEQSQLTGFDDGNSEKSINLKLKKDRKKGIFGKAYAGAGTNDRYEGRFNLNSFKRARQLSILGMGNNTNAEGFSFMDMLNFSGDLSSMKMGGGDIRINISKDDPNAGLMGLGGNDQGIRTTWAGGINYNDLIGTKLDFRSNYMYSHFNPKTESHLQRQYLLPDSSYYYNQDQNSDNINNSHRLNLIGDYEIDSSQSIRFSSSLSHQDSKNHSLSSYQTLSGNKNLTNEGISDNAYQNSGISLRNTLLYRKKFGKRGRTFSLNLGQQYNHSNGDGSQASVNRFFDPTGQSLFVDSILQKNQTRANMNSLQARAAYTEPVFRSSLLEFSLAGSNTVSSSEKTTFDYNYYSGKFDSLNQALSNHYDNQYSFTNSGIKYRMQGRKYNWSVGAAWQYASLEGELVGTGKDSTLKKSFNNILPNARFQYNFNRFRNLVLSYLTMTQQPTISQLQPIPDISNPLNIQLGNPDLNQEFRHMVQLSYTSVEPFRNKNLFAFVNFILTHNKITNLDSVNSLGIKYSLPVNVSSVYSVDANINYGIPFRLIKNSNLSFGLGGGFDLNRQFINGAENQIQNLQLRPEVRLDANLTDQINLVFSAATTFYQTRYSILSDQDTRYFSHELGAEYYWDLPGNFYFTTDFNYIINTRRSEGYNSNVPLWNASISKLLLKSKRGELKFRVFDLLNQNVGINRISNANYIEDRSTVVLKRYFMLSFTFNLNRTGLQSGGKSGDIRIIRR